MPSAPASPWFPILARRRVGVGSVLAVLLGAPFLGAAEPDAGSPARAEEPQAGVAAADSPSWGFSASVFGYFVPDSEDYVQPTVMADHGALHLEIRYQYEALETGSAWVGYRFSGEGPVSWEITPMLGGVFGDLTGVAPGFRGYVAWRWLEFSTESECVVDTSDTSDSFLYTWSELSLAPVDWFRVGVATQRTRAYASEREVSWGPLVGFSFRRLDFAAYGFDLDQETPTLVLGLGLEF